MTENEFLLNDRIAKIKSMENAFSLTTTSYISFSGGKDSCVLSRLIDLALPNNKIPRVFFNTGLEYRQMRNFIKSTFEKDDRILIVNSNENIVKIWENFGYPMKSKQHSHILHIYQNSGKTVSVRKYLNEQEGNIKIHCSKKFLYQFTKDFDLKVSDLCCTKLKKQVAQRFEKERGFSTAITGIRASEGGQRLNMSKCAVFYRGVYLKRFNPLLVVSDEWCEWFIEREKIDLCELYKPPFNFKRTGCIGCPFALNVGEELETLRKYDNRTFDFAMNLWKPVYEEYARLGYRELDKIWRQE